MFPKLWKLNPGKMFLGTYTLKLNNNNTYFIKNNGSLSYTTAYTNDIKFQWNLVYDFKHGNVAIIQIRIIEDLISVTFMFLLHA